MSARNDILAAIQAIEGQRELLGDAGVEAAIASLREQLATLGASLAPAAEAERKQITVMFADLSGFTKLSETADAEDVRNLVNACFESLGAVATRFGGYIDKFIGDELMVLFGAPQAMEDHASRALLAALEMRHALVTFNHEQRLEDAPLGMHFGINSGIVIVGGMGLEARRGYTAMGDPVNVAARLAAQALTGAIFVGADTRRLVGSGFEFEARGSLTLEGRAQPVEVSELSAVHDTAQTTRNVPAEAPLFGRAAELHSLQAALDRVLGRGRPRSVAITGPAGIGKSRLLGELKRWVDTERSNVSLLTGSSLPHTSTTPYHLVADLIRRSIDVRESEMPSDIRDRLDARLRDLGIDDAATHDALATVMAIEADGSALRAMAPRALSERISAAVAELVRSRAVHSPLVLAFEDLHWADIHSINLIKDLSNELSTSPVLLVFLTRPITDDDATRRTAEAELLSAADVRLELAELHGDSCVELVHALVPGLDAFPEVVDTIVRKGQGNPFFVQAVVNTLIERGVLVVGDAYTNASVCGTIDDASVPDTVWGVLADRIDRLPADQKQALQLAAIIGRVFWEGLLADLAGIPIDAGLHSLEERAFIESLGPAELNNDWEWAFRHMLVHEVAYSGMLRSVRREAHLRVAAWLEPRAGERRVEYAPLLAYHYERGENWAKTVECAEEAGDRARQLFANREAGAAYRQALDALARLPPDPETQRRQVNVTLNLAKVTFESVIDVLPALEAAESLAQQLGDDALAKRVKAATTNLLWSNYSREGFS